MSNAWEVWFEQQENAQLIKEKASREYPIEVKLCVLQKETCFPISYNDDFGVIVVDIHGEEYSLGDPWEYGTGALLDTLAYAIERYS